MKLRVLTMHLFLMTLLVLAFAGNAQEADPGPEAADEPVAEAGDDNVKLSVTEAPIQDVLRSLASMRQGMNIIIDPDVTGKVSFKLEDVSWEMALQLITEANGLVATQQGPNIYRVHRPEVKPEEDVQVLLYNLLEVQAMTDDQAMALVKRPEISPETAHQILQASPGMFIKELSVNNRPAIDVVHALARKAELNFAFSADFGQQQAPAETAETEAAAPRELPPISLNLRNISVEDGMKLAAEQGGLSCINKNGVWVVSRLTPAQLEVAPLRMETFQINFIPLDDDLVMIVQTLLTERGKATRGKNKILLVKDTEDAIDTVRQALVVMDVPTPQVLIEARFYQLTEDAEKRVGVDWQDLGDADGASVKATTSPLTYDYWDSKKAIDPAAAGVGAFNALDAKTAILDLPDFEIVLHALESDAGAKALANPKIVVSSDEQASIHIGEQKPIVKSEIEVQDTGGAIVTYELDPDYGGQTVQEPVLGLASGSQPTRTYTTNKGYLDLGTRLTVLPSVKTEEEVYIKVVPELMSLIEEVEFSTGQGTTISFPRLFRTFVRTQFTVRSGQTIAIGGLVSENTTKENTAVPVLGRIPYMGRAFRYERDVQRRSETIIFLTVTVLAGKELNTVHGIPIRARSVYEEVDRIIDEDAEGGVYNQQRIKALMREIAVEEDAERASALKAKLRRLLRLPPAPALAPLADEELPPVEVEPGAAEAEPAEAEPAEAEPAEPGAAEAAVDAETAPN